ENVLVVGRDNTYRRKRVDMQVIRNVGTVSPRDQRRPDQVIQRRLVALRRLALELGVAAFLYRQVALYKDVVNIQEVRSFVGRLERRGQRCAANRQDDETQADSQRDFIGGEACHQSGVYRSSRFCAEIMLRMRSASMSIATRL